jgi:hypothetical protein
MRRGTVQKLYARRRTMSVVRYLDQCGSAQGFGAWVQDAYNLRDLSLFE